jgi:hypothetical protein
MTKHGNNTAIRYHKSFVAPGRALKQGTVLSSDNRDLMPLGPELEAEGQRDNTSIRSAYQIPIIRATTVHL